MKFIYHNINKEEETLLNHLSPLLLINSDKTYNLFFKLGNDFVIKKEGENLYITYEKASQLGRCLLISALIINRNKDDVINQKEHFSQKGIMLDLSRGASLQVNKIKEFIDYAALLGLNSIMLYMEDVFKMDNYPYFGYMRGAYSKEELKEIDSYGVKMGIEIIPCVQTLGHFEQYIKWQEGTKISDTASVILANLDDSYKFIEEIIKLMRECFSTNKIHIGQDEAWGLGTGKYLKKYGYKHQMDIFTEHLIKVNEIVKKYNYEPMIWSDMYFRIYSKKETYYDEDVKITPDICSRLPKNIKVTYWDYYHNDTKAYKDMIDKHKCLSDKIVFAGGIWLWNGLLPDYKTTYETTNAALQVCKEEGIKDIYATAWGDDGCDTNSFWSIPGMALYAQHFYNTSFNKEDLDEILTTLFNLETDDFLSLSEAIYPVDDSKFSIKQIVYSEVLLGMCDLEMNSPGLKEKYQLLKEKYQNLSHKGEIYSEHFSYASTICEIASLRVDLSNRIFKAYPNDKKTIEEIKNVLLPNLEELYKKMQKQNYHMWHTTYKPFGFETTNTRIGGKIASVSMTTERLSSYLRGEIEALEELLETRLKYSSERRNSSFYQAISSSYITYGV